MKNIDMEKLWWIIFIAFLLVWDLFFRAQALWASARHNRKGWFWALLLINSVGILPLIYINSHRDEA